MLTRCTAVVSWNWQAGLGNSYCSKDLGELGQHQVKGYLGCVCACMQVSGGQVYFLAKKLPVRITEYISMFVSS
jgi:hypothetical protein